MARRQLGFLVRVPSGSASEVRRHIDDTIVLAEAADHLGVDSLWVTQHHFGAADSSLASPLVLHAAIAARTRRLRLGTTVVTAALEHPVRLAEDAATLDLLSGGRLELGMGTSAQIADAEVFGVPRDTQRDHLHDTALRVAGLLTGEPASTNQDIRVEPHAPDLAGRLWLATTTPAHAVFAGRHGFGLLTSYRAAATSVGHTEVIAAYRHACADAGHEPRVGISRGVFPCESRADARRQLASEANAFTERGRRLGWLSADFVPDHFFERTGLHYGHPDDIAASLAADPGLADATILLAGMLNARLTPRQLLPLMERIATQVAPRLGWSPNGG